MKARWQTNRNIAHRLVITGTLTLLTPARFGAGEKSQTTDMPLLRDPHSGKPLLPGSSLAGAMRAYLNQYLSGYEDDNQNQLATALFGNQKKDESNESWLTIDDAISQANATEFRPGVKIAPKTRTAAADSNQKGQLYDMELLEAGTTFDLRLELDLPDNEKVQQDLKQALAISLTGFERGEIGLGARKRRGFGECRVENWHIQQYNLKQAAHLLAWLENAPAEKLAGKNAAEKLGIQLPEDARRRFCLHAEFELETSLLIRSASVQDDQPDMSHLHSKRNGKLQSVLSGTSLAGALRARALRIAHILFPGDAEDKVNQLFGPDKLSAKSQRNQSQEPFASPLLVRERPVKGKDDLVQTRIRIDRFTGGTYPGALFEQQPVFGGRSSLVEVSLELRNPKPGQIALLLHLLKDLWTGDLPLGGEASVGRGRLKGRKATLTACNLNKQPKQEWQIIACTDNTLEITGDRSALEAFAKETNHDTPNS